MSLQAQLLDATDVFRDAIVSVLNVNPGALMKRDVVGPIFKEFEDLCCDMITGTRAAIDKSVAAEIRKAAPVIPAKPVAKKEPTMTMTVQMRKALSEHVLTARAGIYQREHPGLTFEQAYAKVFEDPANVEVAHAAITKTMPSVITPALDASLASDRAAQAYDPHVQLMNLAAERQKREPKLTLEGAYAKELENPANGALAMAALGRTPGARGSTVGTTDSSRT